MIFMPIVMINFLIGLAVGDIDAVRKNAQMQRLSMQVNITYFFNRVPETRIYINKIVKIRCRVTLILKKCYRNSSFGEWTKKKLSNILTFSEDSHGFRPPLRNFSITPFQLKVPDDSFLLTISHSTNMKSSVREMKSRSF